MNTQEKNRKIDEFLAGALAFEDTLSMSPDLLTYRPGKDMWSIHEQVVHVLESEVAAFHRYRKAIAEPGGDVVGYDEDKFTAAIDYHAQSLGDSLAGFRLLRKLAAAQLRTIVDRDWTALNFRHSVRGLVNLETWIGDYIGHVADHRALVDRNIKMYHARG